MNDPMSDESGGRYALVVDDDEAIRESLRFILEDEGFSVTDVGDGAAALDALRLGERRMVVLLDEIMPGLDGSEILLRIAGDPMLATRHAYILVTATTHIQLLEQRVAALDSLVVPIVRKPFDITALVDTVRQAAVRLEPAAADGTDDGSAN